MRITRLATLAFATVSLLLTNFGTASAAGGSVHTSQPGFVRSDSFANPDEQDDSSVLAWPQLGFDSGHSGYNTKEKTLSPSNVAGLTPLWTTTTPGPTGGIVASGGVLFGQSSSQLYAMNQSTGATIWTASAVTESFSLAPAVGHKRVFQAYSGSAGTGLCSYSTKTGKIGWCTAISQYSCGLNNTPSVSGNLTFAEFGCGVTYDEALQAKTGNTQWYTAIGNHCAGNDSAQADPILGGMIYYTLGCQGSNNQTNLCAFNAQTGAPGWCVPISNGACGPSGATLGVTGAEGTLFANVVISGSCAEELTAFDAKTGTQKWTVTIPGNNPLHFSPAVADGRVYDYDDSGMQAFSAKTGAVLWTQASSNSGAYGQGMSVANGVVYGNCFSAGEVCALDAKSGAVLWSNGTGGGGATTPIVLDGVVYGSCGGNSFCAYALPQNRRR
jgi:outer membrane protein assembly factor BamB